MKEKDNLLVREVAHSIKGAPANLSFENIHNLSKDIEKTGNTRDMPGEHNQLDKMRVEFEKVTTFVKTL